MGDKPEILNIEKLRPGRPRETTPVNCVCGAVMEFYAEGRYDGWVCPNCGRKRPVISDHRKDPTRWPQDL